MRERGGAPTGYIPELDGLRGIAILLVMVHRMYPHADGTPWPIEAGWVGVDLFFVISGFLIAGILLDTRDDPGYFRNFYARRVLRIFPLFYLLVGGMLLVFPLASHDGFLDQAGSPLWYLLQLGNIPESLLGRNPPYWLAPVWSLAIEEQFYLTFPLLVRRVDPKKLGGLLVAIALLSIITRIITTSLIPDRERIQYLFTLCRLDTIAVGCLLAVFVRSDLYSTVRARLSSLLGPVLAVTGVVLVATKLDRTTWFGRTLGYSVVAVAFGALVLLVLERRDRKSARILRARPLQYMGKLCFGLYLLHRPADTIVRALVTHAGLDVDSLVWLPLKLATALALATLSWRIVEQPFLRLKDRFVSSRHPSGSSTLGLATIAIAVLCVACHPQNSPSIGDGPLREVSDGASVHDDAELVVDSMREDAKLDAAVPLDSIPVDAAPVDAAPPLGRVLYPEGELHSPITADVGSALVAIAGQSSEDEAVFAKIGDSMTATTSFMTCFGSPGFDLGSHAALVGTLGYFQNGDADGTTPYQRASLSATGGWTTADVLAGTPDHLDLELAAISPRYATVLLGTNDVRYGRTVDAFGADLWTAVDRMLSTGTIPILSTLPAMHGDPESNAHIPLFNRVVRAIAQGRSLPLVDFHLALSSLPNEGISADGIHPTVAPQGACALTTEGLSYGYNVRNLMTLEALDRAHRARGGQSLDATATRRLGAGSHAEPFRGQMPLVDMADTRVGDGIFTSYPGCGLVASGREIVYRLELASATPIDAFVVDRGAVDVDVAILVGSLGSGACVAAGDRGASATVGPGLVFIVVDSRNTATEGEFVIVVQPQ